ncbi:MAG: hypothetical protein HQL70_03980 [Magnetococcales bacterium]|nr:hypothetical protein [Magnetococcales bacterium]
MAKIQDPESFPDSKLITCVLPDNGIDSELLKLLKEKKDIITANSFKCRGVAGAADGKRGKKNLEVKSVRVVEVVVPAKQAEDFFEYIYDKTDMGSEDSGFMYQCDLVGATPFILPEGIPDEVEG